MRISLVLATLALTLSIACSKKEEESQSSAPAEPASETYPGTGEDTSQIKWVTNEKDKPFSIPNAEPGGTWEEYMTSFPLTFRLFGPNSNDAFAGWNRESCMMSLVGRHPNTLEFIPELATHWAVMDDQKTLYFKLDPDVRFNDGRATIADDYVFAYNMMLSKEIKDPFYNRYFGERFEKVEKIDKYTLKIVGKRPSWRALGEYQIYPVARHATKLDDNWVKDANWKTPICVGAYKIGSFKRGRSVTLTRVKGWWGDKKRFFKNRFNHDKIQLKVIRDQKLAFKRFQKGDLSAFHVLTARVWAEETDFEGVKKNWIVKKKVYNQVPRGMYGIAMNVQDPFFSDLNIRKAMQHLFDFKKINKNLMYNAYLRKNSSFSGSEYQNKNLKIYGYDPKKARSYLEKAGFKKRAKDGIRVNSSGKRCSFTFTYGSPGLEPHLTVFQQDLKSEGVEMLLKKVDGATAFKYGMQRNYQMTILSRTSGFYPDPEQYFHTSYAKVKDNNNIFGFGTKRIDELIEVYNTNLDKKARQKAMYEIDQIVHDQAIIIHLWIAPFIRMLVWNRYGMPNYINEKRSSGINEFRAFFTDPGKDAALKKAMAEGTALPSTGPVEMDPWGVLK